MFLFKGMPVWAQWVGEIIPATHAMRISRGLPLKGNRLPEILPEFWPIALFALAAIMIAVWFYRETTRLTPIQKMITPQAIVTPLKGPSKIAKAIF